MDYIARHIESYALETYGTFRSLLVTGARQTGKTTLLEHLFPQLSKVVLDDEFAREQARTNPASFTEGEIGST